MNKYTIKAFGVTKEILGGREVSFEMDGKTIGELRAGLSARYPKLIGLKSLYIAVNNNYAEESSAISEADEIALIPPVSGG